MTLRDLLRCVCVCVSTKMYVSRNCFVQQHAYVFFFSKMNIFLGLLGCSSNPPQCICICGGICLGGCYAELPYRSLYRAIKSPVLLYIPLATGSYGNEDAISQEVSSHSLHLASKGSRERR